MFVEFSKSSYTLSEGTFVVDPRYKVLSFIGSGTQGLICAAHNTCAVPPEPVDVAVKKFPNAVDEVVACKRMLREVRMMRHFQHENLLSLRDIMFPPSSNVLLWRDVYLVSGPPAGDSVGPNPDLNLAPPPPPPPGAPPPTPTQKPKHTPPKPKP
jgi:serine/threonine protein kinase